MRARFSAATRPMPEVAPVMTQTFPSTVSAKKESLSPTPHRPCNTTTVGAAGSFVLETTSEGVSFMSTR